MRQAIGFLFWMNLVCKSKLPCLLTKVEFLDQVSTSQEVEVSEPLLTFVTSSDHGVVHIDLLQKHENLTVKKALCR